MKEIELLFFEIDTMGESNAYDSMSSIKFLHYQSVAMVDWYEVIHMNNDTIMIWRMISK